MPLATLKEILEPAKTEKRAVPMFNVVGLEYAEAMINGAEELNMPVLLGMPGAFLLWHNPEVMSNLLLDMARRASVPVALHLDHGNNFDIVMTALRCGFSSVMFDGSALSFEENIRQTAEIVRIAHSMGVSVEGELGYLGFEEHVEVVEDNLTKPEEAAEFVRRTGVDALAVAIGNAHGHYKSTPQIQHDRLRAIDAAVGIPLVLHGGSGLSKEDFQNAVLEGICKVNIFTDMCDFTVKYVTQALAENKKWMLLCRDLEIELRGFVKDYIKLLARM